MNKKAESRSGYKPKSIEEKIEPIAKALIKLMEQDGLSPWQREWQLIGNKCINAATGKPYKGQNFILLCAYQILFKYTTRIYVGFKQAEELGLRMLKGSKAVPIVYPRIKKTIDEETGEEIKTVIGWSYSNVFNLDCFLDTPEKQAIIDKYHTKQTPVPEPDVTKRLLQRHKPNIDTQPFHNPAYIDSLDLIQMPPLSQFSSEEAYAATLIHELAHWTGHSKRLSRNLSRCNYAYEELVAEMTAAIVTSHFNIPYSLEKHASYIKAWIKHLNEQPEAFQMALKDAARASNYLCPDDDTEELELS